MADRPVQVLLIDDDEAMREALGMRIESWGYDVVLAGDGAEAHEKITTAPPDVILTDIVLPGLSGLELLERLKEAGATCPIILMTGHASVGWAVEAMKQGALDFLTKPVDHDHLASLIQGAAEEVELRHQTRSLESRLLQDSAGLGEVVGQSAAMNEVFDSIRLLAQNETSAILFGESGVGKEMVARTIHQMSGRSKGPFIAVNTAAIPEGLIESEVFGHEKGAFTGATSSRPGCFEQADRGTLLLDEIGEMPLSLQPRLLRILEAGRARRLGGSREVEFDVRVLAATNRDLDSLIEDNILREDLFYRLNVFAIRVPPLREHPEDIPLLAQHFVQRFNTKHSIEVEGFRDEVLAALAEYGWPGNIRELRNIVERATILAQQGWIERSHLPRYLREGRGRNREVVLPVGTDMAEAEKRLILETLEAAGGNKTETARRLGLDPKTIYNKLKSYEAES